MPGPVTFQVVSNSTGTSAGGIDVVDLLLMLPLLIGVSYLTHEMVEKGARTRRRLFPPLSIVAIALVGLTVSFVILPATQSVPNSPQIVYVVMSYGSGQPPPAASRGFSPQNVTVVVGVNNTVMWQNLDTVWHNTHSNPPFDGEFDSGVVQPGGVGQHTFTRVGNFAYHCDNNHPWMNGSVAVKGR